MAASVDMLQTALELLVKCELGAPVREGLCLESDMLQLKGNMV